MSLEMVDMASESRASIAAPSARAERKSGKTSARGEAGHFNGFRGSAGEFESARVSFVRYVFLGA
jgi:hypothetical protein